MADWEPKHLEPQKGAGILTSEQGSSVIRSLGGEGRSKPFLYLGCLGPFQSTLAAQFPSMPLHTQHRWLFKAYYRLIGTVWIWFYMLW